MNHQMCNLYLVFFTGIPLVHTAFTYVSYLSANIWMLMDEITHGSLMSLVDSCHQGSKLHPLNLKVSIPLFYSAYYNVDKNPKGSVYLLVKGLAGRWEFNW